jgi:DNA-directed RNA polymerase specialized sigma24 family protein
VGDTFKDEVLLEKARGGDQSAFLLLYERHRTRIFRFLYRFLSSAQMAEELTHDCFIGLVRGSEDSQFGLLFRSRLYLAARTLAMNTFGI